MTHQLRLGRRRAGYAVATVAAVVTAGMAGTTSYATGQPTASSPRAEVRTSSNGPRGFYDTRYGQGIKSRALALRTASHVNDRRATVDFRKSAPGQTVLDIDGSTGTVRMLTRLDGFLTGASGKPAKKIALHYVAQNHAALGLSKADLKTFHLKRDYVDIDGQHHLFFVQHIAGKTVISNGLTASVNKKGHLLTVGGSPVSKSSLGRVSLPTSPRLATAGDALAASRRAESVPAGADLSQDTASRGLFVTPTGAHLAWQTVVMSAKHPALSVVDASTGALLMRRPLTDYESGDSTGKAFQFFPGAPKGGKAVTVDFTKKGWLSRSAHILKGNNSHAYSDVNDDQKAEKSEEVKAKSGQSWSYALKPFHLAFAKSFCSNPWPCSWNPNKPFSWQTNRAQNTTQVFFFVNNWHDHLKAAPIGFTEAAGNFQQKNSTKHGRSGDPVTTQTDDGANTAHGLPDGAHIDNANMSTPPDGRSPRMQMYLQHAPHTSYPNGDPFSPTNVGDEADTVYHEYTHGLSNRLNVDVQGASTLGGVEAGAMGEAWSDWYALDYLVKHHLQKDNRKKVDIRIFKYDGDGVNFDRTEPIDCTVGSKAQLCNGGATGHKGGYTYRDYGKVIGAPEVHSDGEIWAQTLWSLRYELGSAKTESLVTRAMELAPYDPSFLDMRDGILVADTSLYHGKDRGKIWKVFASRGMGFFAGAFGGEDSQPGASFSVPPRHLKLGTIQGTVTDADSGAPVAGLPVTLAFQGKGAVNPTAITDATGHYAISGVPQGKYSKLIVNGAGYQPARHTVTVGASGASSDFAVRRDWAAASGGASVVSATGANFTRFGCGPSGAIDLSEGSGWATNAGAGTAQQATNTFVPKNVVVKLPNPVNLTGFGVDPSTTCGLGASSSTGNFQIETSPDGTNWTPAAAGTFTTADDGRINNVSPTAGMAGVNYVRFTILGNQVPAPYASNCPNGGFDGCTYASLTELEVFGTPAS
jgi:extracellular elastinolytic metalloproteinase